VNLSDVPHVRAAVDDLRPLWPVLWLGFDGMTAVAREQIDTMLARYGAAPAEGGEYDPHYFPHTVRFLLNQELKRRGYDVEYEVDTLPASGLRIHCNGREVRVRKSTRRGGVPELKGSEPLREIYQLILGDDFTCPPQTLLVLWHATPQGVFTGLSVVCLEVGKGHAGHVLGLVDIPNPAESGAFQQMVAQDIADAGDFGDLPIELLTAENDDRIVGEDDAEQAQ